MTTVLRNGRSSLSAASFHATPAMPVRRVIWPLPVTSRVEVRRPSVSTSQACGSFAPGRVVACRYSSRVAGPLLFSASVSRTYGGGGIALVELDAVGVELGVLQLQCLVQAAAERRPLGVGALSLVRPAVTGSAESWSNHSRSPA